MHMCEAALSGRGRAGPLWRASCQWSLRKRLGSGLHACHPLWSLIHWLWAGVFPEFGGICMNLFLIPQEHSGVLISARLWSPPPLVSGSTPRQGWGTLFLLQCPELGRRHTSVLISTSYFWTNEQACVLQMIRWIWNKKYIISACCIRWEILPTVRLDPCYFPGAVIRSHHQWGALKEQKFGDWG